jgi:hypothetical protein
MLSFNKDKISIVISIVALLVGLVFLAHHMMGLSGAYTFCLFVACAFIPVFANLPIVLQQASAHVLYRPDRGSDITLLLEKPPRY